MFFTVDHTRPLLLISGVAKHPSASWIHALTCQWLASKSMLVLATLMYRELLVKFLSVYECLVLAIGAESKLMAKR